MTITSCSSRPKRRPALRMVMLASTILASSLATLSAGVITATFTPLGPNDFQYTYSLSGISLLQNQELLIQFDPTVYGSLSNGQAPLNFNLVLSQPNNPAGAPGAYSALAQIDNPSLSGFSVEVSFLAGSGQAASQPYFIEQFDSGGHLLSEISSGNTIVGAVPEPETVFLALSLVPLWLALRVRRR